MKHLGNKWSLHASTTSWKNHHDEKSKYVIFIRPRRQMMQQFLCGPSPTRLLSKIFPYKKLTANKISVHVHFDDNRSHFFEIFFPLSVSFPLWISWYWLENKNQSETLVCRKDYNCLKLTLCLCIHFFGIPSVRPSFPGFGWTKFLLKCIEYFFGDLNAKGNRIFDIRRKRDRKT